MTVLSHETVQFYIGKLLMVHFVEKFDVRLLMYTTGVFVKIVYSTDTTIYMITFYKLT